MDANFPNRAAQDALAETIRIARIIARDTIARCGGVGLAAYLGALRLSVTPPKPRKGVVAGSCLRGCHSRPAAGVRTHEAIGLLTGDEVQAEAAAELDLAADPGCKAIDAARDALIALLKTNDAGPADRCAREAIRDFDREVGVAVLALRAVVPPIAAKHRAAWGGPVMTLDEAISAGEDGLRKACSVYEPGAASLCTYAVRHGWMMKAIREARPMSWQRFEKYEPQRTGEGASNGQGAGSARLYDNVVVSQAPPISPSVEDQAIEFETHHRRACLVEALIAKTAAAVEAKREDTDAARGVLGLVAGRLPEETEWQPTVRRLRSVWRRSGGSLLPAVA